MSIKWCKNCNLPIAGAGCDYCGNSGEKLRTLESEPYPAFDYHRDIINKLLGRREVFIPPGEFILLTETGTSASKALSEKYYRVIVRGVDIGGFYFDPWKSEYIGEFDEKAIKEFDKRRSKTACFNSRKEMLTGLVKANSNHINDIEHKSKQFILGEVKRSKQPPVVLFSGGHDSRTVLDLAIRSLGKDLHILFSDTGAEVPANLDYIYKTVEKIGMQDRFLVASEKQSFRERIRTFGPPAHDFHWCCKVFKLGPIGSLLNERFQKGCIVLWGFRMGESVYRMVKPAYRDNFINQLSILPIITWSKLDEYLYLYRNNIDINPIYTAGLNSTSCYMCPKGLEYFHIVKKKYPDLWNGWQTFLKSWAGSYNLPESWSRYALWRFTRVPKHMIQALKDKDVDTSYIEKYYQTSLPESFTSYAERALQIGKRKEGLYEDLRFSFVSGISPCTPTEHSIEGVFNKPLDIEKSLNLLTIFGECEYERSLNLVKLKRDSCSVLLFGEGRFKIISKDLSVNRAKQTLNLIKEIIWRSTYCGACGLCISWCPRNAMVLAQKIEVIKNQCNHCLDCLKSYCPTNNVKGSDTLSKLSAIFKYINLSHSWSSKEYTQKETFKSKVLNAAYKSSRIIILRLGKRKFIRNKIIIPLFNFITERRIRSG